MESKLYRAKPLRHGSDGLNRCRSLECAWTGQLRSILNQIPHSIPPPPSVYESVCVWVDKKYYVSFLRLRACLPVCERFHFYTAAVVTDCDPVQSSVCVEGCKRSDEESTDCSSWVLTTVLTTAKLRHITNGSGEGDPEKLHLWLSWTWLIQAHSVPFPLHFTMTTSPVAESFVLSW